MQLSSTDKPQELLPPFCLGASHLALVSELCCRYACSQSHMSVILAGILICWLDPVPMDSWLTLVAVAGPVLLFSLGNV